MRSYLEDDSVSGSKSGANFPRRHGLCLGKHQWAVGEAETETDQREVPWDDLTLRTMLESSRCRGIGKAPYDDAIGLMPGIRELGFIRLQIQ